jgi:hypothetical protein
LFLLLNLPTANFLRGLRLNADRNLRLMAVFKKAPLAKHNPAHPANRVISAEEKIISPWMPTTL